ncbi:dihydrofolate reductase [Candidatus Peregrinibacteria bacterium]|nr:dihydrofolate reductase [Candidatus Peregrinibacteria bacterium]
MNNPKVYLVVAVDNNNGIGKDGKLPWHFKKELQYFSKLTKETSAPTKQNLVIMGRTTWESIPLKFRPLPGRRNIVLTSQKDYQAEGAKTAHSLGQALALADDATDKIFIIGGAKVFAESLKLPKLSGIYLTKIHAAYNCDTHLVELPSNFTGRKIGEDSEEGVKFEYFLWE